MNNVKNAPKVKRPPSLTKRKARAGWLFVLPFVIGILIVYLPIILDSICYSFFQINTVRGGGYTLEFKGLYYYNQALVVNATFGTTLIAGIKQLLVDTPMILIFSLFIAVVLNQKMLGRAAFRAIFFIPVVLSTGLMETIDASNIMEDAMEEGGDYGTETSTAAEIVSAIDIEILFQGMKVGTGLVEYVATMINNIYDIVNRSGVQMLIFLAGLQSISPAIYESCSIDGATGWETFWKITFPMISPMILVNAVYTIIDSFTTNQNTVMKFIDSVYTQSNGKEISSAMSWMYFLIVILIVAIVAAIASAFVFYQRKD